MRVVQIPKVIDQAYRLALLAGAKDAGPKALWYIRRSLDAGPSRGGAQEAMAHFGPELDVSLKMTAMIVDGLEISVPGFKKWLVDTGFGNDLNMIKGFVRWAEYVNAKGKILPDAKRAFEQVS